MVPSTPSGCRVRIKPAVGQAVLADFRADVDPTDTVACLALLRRTVNSREQQLGRGSEVTNYRLEAYDEKKRVWVEHAP